MRPLRCLFGHTWARLQPTRGIASELHCVVCGEFWSLGPWAPPPPRKPMTTGEFVERIAYHARQSVLTPGETPELEAARRGLLL